jgi:hypothetical protein
MHLEPVEVDAEALQLSLEKRLRARVARADVAVELTPETLQRWVVEEFESLVEEFAIAHALAHGKVWN